MLDHQSTITWAGQRVPLEVWSRIIALVDCADEDQGPGYSLNSPLPFHSNELHEAVEPTEAYRVRLKQRIQRLRSLPKVCRQWWKPANEALYRHMCISDDFGLECLAKTFGQDDILAGQVESLSFHNDEHAGLCSAFEPTCSLHKDMHITSSTEIGRIMASVKNLARLDILGGWAGAYLDWTPLRSLPLTTFALEMCPRRDGRRTMPSMWWGWLPSSIVHLSLSGLHLAPYFASREVDERADKPKLRSLSLQDFGGPLLEHVQSASTDLQALHMGAVDPAVLIAMTECSAASVVLLRYCGQGRAKRTAQEIASRTSDTPPLQYSPAQGIAECFGRFSKLRKLQLAGDIGLLGPVIRWPDSIEVLEWECLPTTLKGGVGMRDVPSLLDTLCQPMAMPNLQTMPLLRHAKHLPDNILSRTECSPWTKEARSAAANLVSRGLPLHPAEDVEFRRWSPLLAADLL